MIRELLARALEAPLAVGDASDHAAAAIVVLGAPLAPDGALSEIAAERLAAGVALWRRGLAPLLVVTGGCATAHRPAEAVAMAAAARAAGVPEQAIVVEPRARTTAENAREVARLLPAGAPVWLVTQPFHSRRARWCFRRAGLVPRVAQLADSLQYRDRALALRLIVREYAAWVRAFTPL